MDIFHLLSMEHCDYNFILVGGNGNGLYGNANNQMKDVCLSNIA